MAFFPGSTHPPLDLLFVAGRPPADPPKKEEAVCPAAPAPPLFEPQDMRKDWGKIFRKS